MFGMGFWAPLLFKPAGQQAFRLLLQIPPSYCAAGFAPIWVQTVLDPKRWSGEAVKSFATDGRGANAIVEATGKAEALNRAALRSAFREISFGPHQGFRRCNRLLPADTQARRYHCRRPHQRKAEIRIPTPQLTERDDCLMMPNFMAH